MHSYWKYLKLTLDTHFLYTKNVRLIMHFSEQNQLTVSCRRYFLRPKFDQAGSPCSSEIFPAPCGELPPEVSAHISSHSSFSIAIALWPENNLSGHEAGLPSRGPPLTYLHVSAVYIVLEPSKLVPERDSTASFHDPDEWIGNTSWNAFTLFRARGSAITLVSARPGER